MMMATVLSSDVIISIYFLVHTLHVPENRSLRSPLAPWYKVDDNAIHLSSTILFSTAAEFLCIFDDKLYF